MKIPPGTFILLALLGLVVASLFPATPSQAGAARKAQAKNDVVQLAVAIKAYEVEYGHLPGTNRGAVGPELMHALIGGTNALNPRQIVFFEWTTTRVSVLRQPSDHRQW